MLKLLKQLAYCKDTHPIDEYGIIYDICEVDSALINEVCSIINQIEEGKSITELIQE